MSSLIRPEENLLSRSSSRDRQEQYFQQLQSLHARQLERTAVRVHVCPRSRTATSNRKEEQAQKWLIRTPSKWLGKVWEFQATRACAGWDFHLRPIVYIPNDCLAVDYAIWGYVEGLQRLFEMGEITPFVRTCDSDRTLLHVSFGLVPCRRLLTVIRSPVPIANTRFAIFSSAKEPTFMRCRRKTCECGSIFFQTRLTLYRMPFELFFAFQLFIGYLSTGPLEADFLDFLRLFLREHSSHELCDIDGTLRILRQVTGPKKAIDLILQETYPPYKEWDVKDRIMMALLSQDIDPNNFLAMLGYKSIRDMPITELDKYSAEIVCKANYAMAILHTYRWWQQAVPVKALLEDWRTVLKEAVYAGGIDEMLVRGASPVGEFLEPSIRLWYSDATAALQVWARELRNLDVDLYLYGVLEEQLFRDNHGFRDDYFICVHDTMYDIRLINFKTGPEVEDWQVWTTWPLDEFAGEFWHMIESPELFIPGSWPSTDGNMNPDYRLRVLNDPALCRRYYTFF